MEKKGNILTQLALISDLLERANVESESTKVTITVSQEESDRLFKLITSKANASLDVLNETFTVKIGLVEYVFVVNTNSV